MMKTENLIINFTPTGMIPTKKQTPFVPVKPSEIINDVLEAYTLGITSVHLHARNSHSQQPDYKAEIYAEIISGIRKYAKDLVICVSLSGRNFNEFEQRSNPLTLKGNLKPDMGSLTLSSLKKKISNPILLLYPPYEGRFFLKSRKPFPLGLLYIAAYLKNKGIDANVVDFMYPYEKSGPKRIGWSEEQIINWLRKNLNK